MTIEFVRHIFCTLTFTRTDSSDRRWKIVSKTYNRYIQRIRRLHNLQVHYLRVVESHKDGYPHIHVLLQFPSASIRVDNSRYFDPVLYKRWKSLWPDGHSDYQRPRRSGMGTLGYIMKYLLKNSSSKTVWSKVYAVQNDAMKTQRSLANLKQTPMDGSVKSTISEKNSNPTRQHGVKLCTWSRGFDFTPFLAPKKK